RYSKQSIFITDKMLEESKKLIEAMGLPVVEAPSEADAQMAFMNKQDDVWACGTTDYDVLLHEAPKMIANLTLSQKRRFGSGKIITIHPELIELKSVLKELNLTQDQLIVLAILVGTDYNPEGIRGVGPKKALKLVRENKDFDELFTGLNADFDWKKVFDTFKKMEVKKNYDLKWREIDVDAIKKILVEKHEFSEERIDSTLKKAEKASSMKGQKSLGEFFK
ncbi:MAG: flap structure-specific endonuclease, partial [Nanoarchaeota archaeon]